MRLPCLGAPHTDACEMSCYPLPSLGDVDKAARLIDSAIRKTPVKVSPHLSRVVPVAGIELFFKCENLQRTGSFKFRGASHFLAKLDDHELEQGVVAYSTGLFLSECVFLR